MQVDARGSVLGAYWRYMPIEALARFGKTALRTLVAPTMGLAFRECMSVQDSLISVHNAERMSELGVILCSLFAVLLCHLRRFITEEHF